MVNCKRFNLPDGFELNYDNLYVIPANKDEYIINCVDTQYSFGKSDFDEICEKINSVGCTSFLLSKEDLAAVIEKLDRHA